jgi:type IV pilus assembly protein PilW
MSAPSSSPSIARAGGFSLVELMVSVVIGLLAVLFATRIMTDSERNKDAALGGSDSMQNGMLAMFQISSDAEQAGFGLNDPLITGCNTMFADSQGYELAPAKRGAATIRPLAAAVIEPGGTGPDRLTLYAGGAPGGTSTMRVIKNYIGGTSVEVDRDPWGYFTLGDVIVVAPENIGADCALAQISKVPDKPELAFGTTSQRFNRGALGANYTGNTTRLFNLGSGARLAFHTWSVEDGYLRLRATDMANAAKTAQAVTGNIVSLKAQYGFDRRLGAAFALEKGTAISAWSSTMIDADGDGVTGSPGDYGRIVALRIAVVARSKNPERPAANGTCSATTTAPTLFARAQPSEATAQKVDIDLAVTNDPIDWKCYRYRVFDTIVPLRNAGWRP